MKVGKYNLYQILRSCKRGFECYLLVNLVFITGYAAESEPKNTDATTTPRIEIPSEFLKLSYQDIYNKGGLKISRIWNIGEPDHAPEITQMFDDKGQEIERLYDFDSDGVIDKKVTFK